jgi:hypothetical protein
VAPVSLQQIRRLETATGVRGDADTQWRLQQALEGKGIEFIPEEARAPLMASTRSTTPRALFSILPSVRDYPLMRFVTQLSHS